MIRVNKRESTSELTLMSLPSEGAAQTMVKRAVRTKANFIVCWISTSSVLSFIKTTVSGMTEGSHSLVPIP